MKVIFIHGYDTNPLKRKYRIIKQGLADMGVDCAIPAMPGGLRPSCDEWIAAVKKEIDNSPGRIALVGHSLGTAAILLYLDRYSPENIDVAILFSAVDVTLEENQKKVGGNIADFYRIVDYGKIKERAKTFIISSSEDDPIIEFEQGKGLSQKLAAKFLPVKDMGHFKGEATTERDAAYILSVIKTVL